MLYLVLLGRAVAVIFTIGAAWVALYRDFPKGDQFPGRLYIAIATVTTAVWGTLYDLHLIEFRLWRQWSRVTGPMLFLAIAMASFLFIRAAHFRRSIGPVIMRMGYHAKADQPIDEPDEGQ